VLRRLELDVSRRLDGLLHGDHRGLVPGHGSEPGEARRYHPGDDVRQMDWNVTARTGSAHIRATIADRELETWLIVDRSASLEFGTAEMTKADLALSGAAAVGLLTTRGGNRLGALISGPDGIVTVPARQGRRHVLSVLAQILRYHTADGPADPDQTHVDLGATLARAGTVLRRRGLIVVVSDFLDDIESWGHGLGALNIRNEVLCIEVVDPRESELPAVGVLALMDTETGRVREVNTNQRSVRERFAAAAFERRQQTHAAIIGSGSQHVRLSTDGDWLAVLAGHVSSQKRRRANTASVGAHR